MQHWMPEISPDFEPDKTVATVARFGSVTVPAWDSSSGSGFGSDGSSLKRFFFCFCTVLTEWDGFSSGFGS